MKIKSVECCVYDQPVRLYKLGKNRRIHYSLAEGDYAGFQLRIGALMSQEPAMIHAFRDLGGDLHSVTAVQVFHPLNDITLEEFLKHKGEKPYKSERRSSKFINFGFIFGKIAPSFAKQDLEPNWTPDEAKQFCKNNNIQPKNDDYYLAAAEFIRNKFFSTYSRLMPWMESLHKQGRRTGAIYSAFGARRLVPELTYVGQDDDRKVISNLENICVNSPVQNHESAVINRSMRKASDMFEHGCEENDFTPMETHINGMTHDAVNWTVDDEDKPWVWKKLHAIFETDYPENQGVPISYEIDDAHPDDPENPTPWAFGEPV